MASFEISTIPTKPFDGQKPGTSGLRKKVKVFMEGFYLHNFIQSIFNSLPQDELKGCTLVVGGDGRYFNDKASQIIIKIAAANGVGKILIGQDGILSTPATSAVIRGRKAYGAIILTASHNPGGPENDFGVKYNVTNGGPAPENVTDKIYEHTKKITEYKIANIPDVDLSKLGTKQFGNFQVEVIDSVDDYLKLLKTIFDFDSLKKLFERPDFTFLSDSLNGVTGPYCKRIFVDELKAPLESLRNYEPKPDFGGGHPDPNLTYASTLVKEMSSGKYEFGAAYDGDGDRNMILGKNFFVNPSDSLAILAANAECIPYFKGKLKGVSRSMPTGSAIDKVANKKNLEFYEVPTGWKFFGNLMDAGKIQICGEESFGTGSDHIREKDGVWAILAWLSILAAKNSPGKPFVSVESIAKEHWKQFGKNFFTRYDYEEVASEGANQMMQHLETLIEDPNTKGKKVGNYTIQTCDNFEYKDPIDGSVAKKQGIRFVFSDGSRLVFRLSGTGSSGATIRMYIDKYEQDEKQFEKDSQEALKDLIEVALELSQLKKFTGREKPTVIT